MDNITIFGQVDEDLRRTIQFLQERNVNVVVRDERDLNTIRIREGKEKRKAISKETEKAIPSGKGKEHANPVAHNENVLSKAALAQRARRERERNQNSCSSYQLEQRMRRERERSNECINPRQHSVTPNWPAPTTPSRNVGVVIHDEHDLNVIRIRAAKEKEKVNPMSKGKEKVTPSGKRMTNACQVAQNDNVISKASLAQRARREREQKRSEECIQPIHPSLAPNRRNRACLEWETITEDSHSAEKRTMVAHHSTCSFSMPSTSLPPQRNRSTSINQFLQEDLCTDDELEDMPMSTSIDARAHNNSCRHYLGKMDVLCPYCSGLHWMDEKLTKSSIKRPLFGTCCLEGKIRLPLLITPPPSLQALYDENNDQSKSFRSYTRLYNAANAFTSLGATLDPRVLSGKGPTSFTIHGELRHRTGSLQPQPGQDASYAQLYIYDPDSALEIRNRRNPNLRRDVLKTIQDSLLQVNAFVATFRQAHAILHQLDAAGNNLPAHLHYNSTTDRRRYNLPTADEIAIVIPGDGTELSGMRDIILHFQGNNELMQINECHPAYLPLHYVLIMSWGFNCYRRFSPFELFCFIWNVMEQYCKC